jgi:hypothetical protein
MVHKLEHHGETYHAHGKAEDGDDVLGLVLEQVAPSGFEMVENHIFLFFIDFLVILVVPGFLG